MKVALVTGGSRGIGREIVKTLAENGYRVAFTYLNSEDKAKALTDLITAKAYRCDLRSPSEIKALFEAVKTDYGRLDLLVNNAGVAYIGLLQDMSDGEIENVISADLSGSIYCSREAVKLMVAKHSGCIINISSMWGEVGSSCEAVYSACKAGVIGLTKALAKELGPSGIRVNCVSPGLIATEMNSSLDEETLTALKEETPLGRIGEVSDIAKAVKFLASDEASFITGQILSVNGGMII